MGIRVGIPVLKLSRSETQSKRKGNAGKVIKEAFSERYSKDQDLDRSKSIDNKYYGFQRGKDLLNMWEEKANAHRDARGRKLRSDAVIGYALIIKPDIVSMSNMNVEERTRFLDDSFKVMSGILNEHNLTVDAAALHRDEVCDHIHIFGRDEEFKASKKIDIILYRDINKEFPARMRKLGYDVEDMSVYDTEKAKNMSEEELVKYKKSCREKKNKSGRSSSKYKADKNRELNAKIMEFEKQRNLLEETRKRLEEEEKEKTEQLKKLDEQLKAKKDSLEKIELRARHLEDRELNSTKKIEELEKKEKELNESITDRISKLDNLESEIEEEKKEKLKDFNEKIDRALNQATRAKEKADNIYSEYEREINKINSFIDILQTKICERLVKNLNFYDITIRNVGVGDFCREMIIKTFKSFKFDKKTLKFEKDMFNSYVDLRNTVKSNVNKQYSDDKSETYGNDKSEKHSYDKSEEKDNDNSGDELAKFLDFEISQYEKEKSKRPATSNPYETPRPSRPAPRPAASNPYNTPRPSRPAPRPATSNPYDVSKYVTIPEKKKDDDEFSL